METLTRLVSESLARHGFERPVDYRRLQWSRWFRCESHHSLLCVPSKPGVFALAEEIMDIGKTDVATPPLACPERPRALQGGVEWGRLAERSSAYTNREGHEFTRAEKFRHSGPALAAEAVTSPKIVVHDVEEPRFSAALPAHEKGAPVPPGADSRDAEARRLLAVTQFFEDDDMAYVLDRMLSRNHPMRTRLESGRYFVRYVEIRDQAERRSICSALNQWITSSAEKATGIGQPSSGVGET